MTASLFFPDLTMDDLSHHVRTCQPIFSQGCIKRFPNWQALCTAFRSEYLSSFAGTIFEVGDKRRGSHTEETIPMEETSIAFSRGSTIRYVEVNSYLESVEVLLAQIAEELGMVSIRRACNLYMSPPDSGLPAHYDDHDIAVLQIEGIKKWRIARRTGSAPPSANYLHSENLVDNIIKGSPPTRESEWLDVPMHPGSILYLPAGYWHKTQAVERSLSLTVGFWYQR